MSNDQNQQNQNQNQQKQRAATGISTTLNIAPADLMKPQEMASITTFGLVLALAAPVLFWLVKPVAKHLFRVSDLVPTKPELTFNDVREAFDTSPALAKDKTKVALLTELMKKLPDEGRQQVQNNLAG